MGTIRIIISPAGHRFAAALATGRVLVESARCPLLESARLLLAEGVDPDTVVEMQHWGSPIVAMSGRIGKLAALTVTENDRVGPIFSKYVPFSGPLASDSLTPLHGGALQPVPGLGRPMMPPEPEAAGEPTLVNTRPRLKRQEDAA